MKWTASGAMLLALSGMGCTSLTGNVAEVESRIVGERVVQVTSEKPYYVSEDGEVIGVDGIQPGQTVTLKLIQRQLPDGKTIELAQTPAGEGPATVADLK